MAWRIARAIVYDDARHFVLTTREKFDVITSDPIHPWVKGAATLYTQEYFEHVKAHLNPGGVVTQWVPLYESNAGRGAQRICHVFRRLSRRHRVAQRHTDGSGYDVGAFGADWTTSPSMWMRCRRIIDSPGVRGGEGLAGGGGLFVDFDVLPTYSGRGSDLAPWLRAPRSIRTAICACSISPGSASTTSSARRSATRCWRIAVPYRPVHGPALDDRIPALHDDGRREIRGRRGMRVSSHPFRVRLDTLRIPVVTLAALANHRLNSLRAFGAPASPTPEVCEEVPRRRRARRSHAGGVRGGLTPEA